MRVQGGGAKPRVRVIDHVGQWAPNAFMRHLEWTLLREVTDAGQSLVVVFGDRIGPGCLDAIERSLARRSVAAPPVALVVGDGALAHADRAVARLCSLGVICAAFTSVTDALNFGEKMARLWCRSQLRLVAEVGEAGGASEQTPLAAVMGR